MGRFDWWVDSGMAADAAQGLVWFVVLVFVVLGIMAWLDMRKDK